LDIGTSYDAGSGVTAAYDTRPVTDRPPPSPAQRLAERRLLAAVGRLQRRDPIGAEVRVDAVLAEMHRAAAARPPGHRGSGTTAHSQAELLQLVAGLVAEGRLVGDGRRVGLPGAPHAPRTPATSRVRRLLDALETAGWAPPPVEALARGLGLPASLVDQLRARGDLIPIASGFDYPRATWTRLQAALANAEAHHPISVSAIRDELGVSRRVAEGILARWRSAQG